MENHPRPLSPHLTIYRPQITSVLSILHRITGVALYAGTAVLIIFLYTIAYAPSYFEQLHECLSSIIGRALLFGWTFAFFLHFYNGIRHLFWDIGKGFDIATVTKTGWITIFATIISTLVSWAYAYHIIGAL